MMPHDDEKFAIGRIKMQQIKLEDWLMLRGKEHLQEPEKTDVDASPMPLEYDGDEEQTVVATHPIIEVEP